LNARRHRRHYPITVRQGRIRFKPIWDRYKVANPFAYWLSQLRADAAENLELADKLEIELPTKTASSLAGMMQASIGALPATARLLLSIAIAADVPIPWSTCAELLGAKQDPSELTIAVNRLKAVSLISEDAEDISVHPIVRRAGRRLLGPQEIERCEKLLIAHLRTLYSTNSVPQDTAVRLTEGTISA
jgi:hypothetical protein